VRPAVRRFMRGGFRVRPAVRRFMRGGFRACPAVRRFMRGGFRGCPAVRRFIRRGSGGARQFARSCDEASGGARKLAGAAGDAFGGARKRLQPVHSGFRTPLVSSKKQYSQGLTGRRCPVRRLPPWSAAVLCRFGRFRKRRCQGKAAEVCRSSGRAFRPRFSGGCPVFEMRPSRPGVSEWGGKPESTRRGALLLFCAPVVVDEHRRLILRTRERAHVKCAPTSAQAIHQASLPFQLHPALTGASQKPDSIRSGAGG
jgi:hypothetical protein